MEVQLAAAYHRPSSGQVEYQGILLPAQRKFLPVDRTATV